MNQLQKSKMILQDALRIRQDSIELIEIMNNSVEIAEYTKNISDNFIEFLLEDETDTFELAEIYPYVEMMGKIHNELVKHTLKLSEYIEQRVPKEF